MVAAAIVAGAAVAATGTAVAGSEAASATKSATNATIAAQQQALSSQQQLEQPYNQLGTSALPQYENLLGIGSGGASGIQAALAQTPGYQFALGQGETGILNAASASGGVGGNTLAALDQYNVGQASQTYQQNVGDLAQAVGTGQAAASGQAQNVGNAAANIGNALTAQGQTTAGIDANLAAGLTKAAGNASNQYVTNQTLQALNNQGGGGSSTGGGNTMPAGDGYTFSY